MHLDVITIPLNSDTLATERHTTLLPDDGRTVTSIDHHVITRCAQPKLVIIVTYEQTKAPRPHETGIDALRARLRPEDALLFDQLRRWRHTKATAMGVPAYRILTNRALAGVAALRPSCSAELALVPGIGPQTIARCGEALIELMTPFTGPSHAASPKPNPSSTGLEHCSHPSQGSSEAVNPPAQMMPSRPARPESTR